MDGTTVFQEDRKEQLQYVYGGKNIECHLKAKIDKRTAETDKVVNPERKGLTTLSVFSDVERIT